MLVHKLYSDASCHKRTCFFKGLKGYSLSCTLYDYSATIAKTSPEFIEGRIFQFTDFDEPILADTVFFRNPHQFYEEYTRQFPNSRTAVSWEYVAALDIWLSDVKRLIQFRPSWFLLR